MRLRRRSHPSDSENVLPLINIVFLLLIFFMVAGVMEQADLFTIEPPESRAGSEAHPGDGLLLMAPDGRLALDGQPIDRARLAAVLAAYREENPGVELTLKADANGDAVEVIGLLEDLRKAGEKTVILLTTEVSQ